MPTKKRTQTGKKAAAAPPANTHRSSDAWGIGLIAIALVTVLALWAGNAGLVGDSLAQAFRVLVGRAAWAVPVVIGFAGASLLAGRTKVKVGRLTTGSVLVFLGLVAFFAQQRQGDFFDPETVAQSGGYIGAVVAWLFTMLFGGFAAIGFVATSVIGLVLCLDSPIHAIIAAVAERRKQALEAAPKPVTKKAVVNLEEDEPPAKPVPAEKNDRAKKAIDVLNRRTEVVETGETSVPAFKLETRSSDTGYELPPLDLLTEPVNKAKRSKEEMQKNIETLELTLEQFGIDANVVEVATGPAITRYELQLGPGIRVNRITALGDNIAMNLAASHVRVEAPIPGKNAIGVEVPNAVRSMVTLREMCESLEFHSDDLKLGVALGRDVSGTPKYADLTKMPHLLVAGATNSGKSICLATMIMSLIVRHTPKEVRLVMIDPKRVELTLFEGLPHLMCPVVKDVKEAAGVLRAVVREMERRMERFNDARVRNIDGWNAKAEYADKLPYIVVILDEMADLMVQAQAEVETSIMRLAQLARAAGIHLVLATQRPSVDVITGTVKNNIPSRIAFAVSSHIDSRTILDQAGADKLIGKGDMLFMPIDQNKPTRIQGCFVTEKEIESVCDFWRAQGRPEYVISAVQMAIEERESEMREEEESDALWEDAVRFVVSRGEASTSMLQRKFSIGFQRASRLLDLMESRSIVGPRDGPRPREVLVDPMQVEQMFGRSEYMTPMPDGATIDDDEQF
ncbi:MAG: DNA translocase FtsK [Armatimonadetes bacterium]|nr:DNA translocase FtsK [Armatimonadota bacterium]